jgi:tetratricopeptide (TPR) repeat protein
MLGPLPFRVGEGKMGGQEVLFILFGFPITIALAFTLVAGTFGVSLAVYKLIERWLTRKARRLVMLREYLDKEEKDITGRRPKVLDGIRMSEHSFLSDKNFDVGVEIDRAIELLDRGYPQLASGKLAELEKRLETNEEILRRRADDLKKHTASVHIFLAALADRNKNPKLGLEYIDKAINYDGSDLDALKYKAVLLLNKGELDGAEQCFTKLKNNSKGNENASYRADAYLGLASVSFKREPPALNDVVKSLGTALQNMNIVPASSQDHFTLAQIHRLHVDVYNQPGSSDADRAKAVANYKKAKNSLSQIGKKRKVVDTKIREIQSKIDQLGGPQ